MRGDGGGDIGGCCGLLRAYRLANAYRPVETGVGPVGQEAVCKVGPLVHYQWQSCKIGLDGFMQIQDRQTDHKLFFIGHML